MSPFKDGILEGKVAFVAGGTSGINLGIAKRYAELGAKVAVLGRNPEKAANAAAEIGHGAIGLTADVRDYGATRAAMEEVRNRFGPLDIVVSGAAGNFLAPVLGMSANALALALHVPAPRINDVVRERRGVTPDTALRLARFFDTTAQFWLNLQTAFDLKQAEREAGEKIAVEVRPMQRAA